MVEGLGRFGAGSAVFQADGEGHRLRRVGPPAHPRAVPEGDRAVPGIEEGGDPTALRPEIEGRHDDLCTGADGGPDGALQVRDREEWAVCAVRPGGWTGAERSLSPPTSCPQEVRNVWGRPDPSSARVRRPSTAAR